MRESGAIAILRITTLKYAVLMTTTRELLLQELADTSDELLNPVLQFVQFLKAHPEQSAELQLDTLETIISLRQGLAEFDRGEGIPAAQALAELQERLQIPPRP